MDYYERAGLTPYLDKLGFNLVGYGCTTCIGNSGPLPEPVSAAVNEADLAVVSVLSGNRNFEGRINPDVKMNYLASPPLVVAYALAGSMDVDITTEPLGAGSDGEPVYLRDIWPSAAEVQEVDRRLDRQRDVHPGLRRRVRRRRAMDLAADPDRRHVRLGRRVDLRAQAALLRRHAARAGAGHRHRRRAGAGQARRLGHHRPHLAGRCDQDRLTRRTLSGRARRRAARLQLLRLPPRQPRGDDPRHVRQHPAAQPAGAGRRGRHDPQPAHRRADDDLRRLGGVRGGRRAAGDPGRQGVRLGLLPRLGGQGHRAARRARGDRRVVRAHPPVQPASAWASSRCSTRRARRPSRSG